VLLGVRVVSNPIKSLSLQLANQIAAGEVVERPASVVKELLENSIDAHSTQITIDIEQGGRGLIRISDNGDGINKDELPLAVTRHATSKITSLNDLEQIMSLGFRGEALASISAVSKLSIKSKPADQQQAWMIDTGTQTDFANYNATPSPVSHPQGTTIDIFDLFYNTPARRKFMRAVKTEFKHIDDSVKHIALSHFDISFKLSHNKKLLRNLPKANTDKAIVQRISKLFSAEFLNHSNKIDFSSEHFANMGSIRLWGWVSQPSWNRKQTDWQYFYVNGRYIKDRLVNHALRQAYQELLPEDAHAAYLLYLEIDPKQVDVNVHPTKHEVRFRQTRLVHDFIFSALKETLTSQAVAIQPEDVSRQTAMNNRQDGQYHHPYSLKQASQTTQTTTGYTPAVKTNHISQHQVAEQLQGFEKLYAKTDSFEQSESEAPEQAKQALFFGHSMGCLMSHYMMSQSLEADISDHVFIIHIKRAQQFLLTHLFKKSIGVSLLIPESLNFSSAEIETILQFQPTLLDWGLDLGRVGQHSLLLRKAPDLCLIPGCKIDYEQLIKGLIEVYKEKQSLDDSVLLNSFIESIQSKKLTLSEQDTLLNMLNDSIDELGVDLIKTIKPAFWKRLDDSTFNTLLA